MGDPDLRMHCRLGSSGTVEWTYIKEEEITWRPPTVEALRAREALEGRGDEPPASPQTP